ncbi:MAG: exodeoxyribonuclease VII small subunit [Bacilli bacterium]|nr:exodeoxyribonuclease VII small subunit [Bacilli bacterium]
MAEKKEVNFQKELERLNEIVEKISSKVISLDESLKLYEEGTQIIKTLEDELKTAEEKIEKVITIE